MTRKQFVKTFETQRENYYRDEVKSGRMRPSEAAMGLACAAKDAVRYWRKHRAAYARVEAPK